MRIRSNRWKLDIQHLAGVSYTPKLICCRKRGCDRCGGTRTCHGPYWYASFRSRDGARSTLYLGRRLSPVIRQAIRSRDERRGLELRRMFDDTRVPNLPSLEKVKCKARSWNGKRCQGHTVDGRHFNFDGTSVVQWSDRSGTSGHNPLAFARARLQRVLAGDDVTNRAASPRTPRGRARSRGRA